MKMWKYIAAAIIFMAFVSAITLAYYSWRDTQRMIGWNNALAAVEKKDAEAKEVVTELLGDIDECEANGGTFNISTGLCDR